MNFDVTIVKQNGSKETHWCCNAAEVGRLSDEAKANGWECWIYPAC